MTVLCEGATSPHITRCLARARELLGKADCQWPTGIFLTVLDACDDHKARELLKKRNAFTFRDFFNAPKGEPMLEELISLAKEHHIPILEPKGGEETKERIRRAVEATRNITFGKQQ